MKLKIEVFLRDDIYIFKKCKNFDEKETLSIFIESIKETIDKESS